MTSRPPINEIILALPAYNEAAVIGELLRQAAEELKKIGLAWRIIVVDDGSRDDTAKIAREAAAAEPAIDLVQHERNLGLGPAILTGLARAAETARGPGSLVVCMDSDLTHPVEAIGRLRRAADEGADLVIASRYQPGSEVIGLSAFRHLLSWGARRIFSLLVPMPGVRDYTCGYRAFRVPLIARGFEAYGHRGLITRRGFACTDELLVKLFLLGPVIREIPFILRYDLKQGASKIRLGVTIAETLRLIRWTRGEMKRARRERRG